MDIKTNGMRATRVLVMAVVVVMLAGCASIIHGTTQDVGISSSPSSATVWVNGRELGRTPLTTSLARKDNHIIRIELPGYLPYETIFTRSVSGWVWGNIVFGGVIGLAVDAISGGMYKLTPEQINARLRADNREIISGEDDLLVFVVLQPDPEWRQIGSLARKD